MGWQRQHFSRRRYVVEGEILDKKGTLIEVIVMINGKQHTRVQCREPGIVAVVSKPDDQGFEIDMIEHTKGGFVDRAVPEADGSPLDWHFQALGIPHG